MIGGLCYATCLIIAVLSDVRTRRIPNRLVLVMGVLGMLFSVVVTGPLPGIGRALLGCAIGLGLWLPFYALRMLGAGDVKLFAAAGCWLAPSQLFEAAVLSALAGGVLSVVGLVLAHGFELTTFRIAQAMREPRVLAHPLPVPAGRRTIPYGVAMAVGLSLAGWAPRLLGP
jgi:prepilin peptidase CpaA